MKNVLIPKDAENTKDSMIPLSLCILARCYITEYSSGLL